MPPILALSVWFVLLVALFRYDSAVHSKTSTALWIPLAWLSILGSRLPSQWLEQGSGSAFEAFQEGNPLDRVVYVALMVSAVGILATRRIRWPDILSRNLSLLLLLAFALVSFLWSDFPFIALKRWFRDFGIYLMALVILTDPRPQQAIEATVRRLCYLLIPLSIVLIKYYPHLGRSYSEWTGDAFYQGVTTSKNLLGVLCLISGAFFAWDSANRWSARRERTTRRILFVNAAFLGMTLWLLRLADSATSRICLLIACAIIIAAYRGWLTRNPSRLTVLLPAALVLYLALEFAFNITAALIESTGRSTTLTGRTELWSDLLGLASNPILGAGYNSFWLGERLQRLWTKYAFRPTQAHSGYLEVYLNLGLIGISLLAAVLISAYRQICRTISETGARASALSLAFWMLLLFYNIAEAAFCSHLLWFMFLLGGIRISVPAENRRPAEVRKFVHSRKWALPSVRQARTDQ